MRNYIFLFAFLFGISQIAKLSADIYFTPAPGSSGTIILPSCSDGTDMMLAMHLIDQGFKVEFSRDLWKKDSAEFARVDSLQEDKVMTSTRSRSSSGHP